MPSHLKENAKFSVFVIHYHQGKLDFSEYDFNTREEASRLFTKQAAQAKTSYAFITNNLTKKIITGTDLQNKTPDEQYYAREVRMQILNRMSEGNLNV